MPNTTPNPTVLTFQVRIAMTPAIGTATRKASRRKVKTYCVSVADSTIGGWSQTSADLAIADWQKQARLRVKSGHPVFDLKPAT